MNVSNDDDDEHSDLFGTVDTEEEFDDMFGSDDDDDGVDDMFGSDDDDTEEPSQPDETATEDVEEQAVEVAEEFVPVEEYPESDGEEESDDDDDDIDIDSLFG